MNHRHHMAQLAARNSVEFFTHLFFRDNRKNGILAREEAYIIKMVKNGFAAIVPKYGIEGLIFLSDSTPTTKALEDSADAFTAIPREWKLSYDSESDCIVSAVNPCYKLEIFQKILVSLKPIEEKDAQASLSRRQLKFSLVWPNPLETK